MNAIRPTKEMAAIAIRLGFAFMAYLQYLLVQERPLLKNVPSREPRRSTWTTAANGERKGNALRLQAPLSRSGSFRRGAWLCRLPVRRSGEPPKRPIDQRDRRTPSRRERNSANVPHFHRAAGVTSRSR